MDFENNEDFHSRMQALTSRLSAQLEESHQLETLISSQLKGLGYEL
jgi:hypothetical protein